MLRNYQRFRTEHNHWSQTMQWRSQLH